MELFMKAFWVLLNIDGRRFIKSIITEYSYIIQNCSNSLTVHIKSKFDSYQLKSFNHAGWCVVCNNLDNYSFKIA